MKTSQPTDLLQASLTNSSLSSDQQDQALPSLSSSHSISSDQDCPPALATLCSAASQVLKRSFTEPGEDAEPAPKRAKLTDSFGKEAVIERQGSYCEKDRIAILVPSKSFIAADLPSNPPPSPTVTQLEYDPVASISSFGKSPSVQYAEQLGLK